MAICMLFYFLNFYLLKKCLFLCWRIVDLPCCVSFRRFGVFCLFEVFFFFLQTSFLTDCGMPRSGRWLGPWRLQATEGLTEVRWQDQVPALALALTGLHLCGSSPLGPQEPRRASGGWQDWLQVKSGNRVHGDNMKWIEGWHDGP